MQTAYSMQEWHCLIRKEGRGEGMKMDEEARKRPLVLAVDDEEINLFLVEQILGTSMEVAQAVDGREALAYLARRKADLVLLDYNMPGMNGIEVLEHMKSRPELQAVPVIILTADADAELETAVFKSGAVDFIRKPFVARALQERVSRILQNERLKLHLQEEVAYQTQLAQERLAMMERLFEETVQTLAMAIDAKDAYTRGHSVRVADYARRIAQAAGMSEEKQQEIHWMGLLHDVGKIGILDSIITKPSRLTDEEYKLIKSHTNIGATILSRIKGFPQLALGARHHHERWDGKGYPDGLGGEEIPIEARVIAVADAYDAMTSRRSYRDAMLQEQVRAEIEKGGGSQFDPAFTRIMLDFIAADKDFLMREHEEGWEMP